MGKRKRERIRQLEERTLDPSASYPDIDAALFARQRGLTNGIAPTVREALGIPAVNRAVTMLATTAGSLDLNAYRAGERLIPDPPLIARPTKGAPPGRFTRDSVFYMACYGEVIWLTTERYAEDGAPASVVPVPPTRIRSDWDGTAHDWKTIGKDGKERDWIHGTLAR